jgi:hypothetical protein
MPVGVANKDCGSRDLRRHVRLEFSKEFAWEFLQDVMLTDAAIRGRF